MVTALVLIHAEGDRVDEVAQKLIAYPGVSEVYSIAGEWDLAAILRVSRNEEVADLVTHRILRTPEWRRPRPSSPSRRIPVTIWRGSSPSDSAKARPSSAPQPDPRVPSSRTDAGRKTGARTAHGSATREARPGRPEEVTRPRFHDPEPRRSQSEGASSVSRVKLRSVPG